MTLDPAVNLTSNGNVNPLSQLAGSDVVIPSAFRLLSIATTA